MLNCATPSLLVSFLPSTNQYTSANTVPGPFTGPSLGLKAPAALGNWTTVAYNPVSGCRATQTFVVMQNTVQPSSGISTQFLTINCTSTSVPVSATGSPSVQIRHEWISVAGTTLMAYTPTSTFMPGAPGTYTHCFVNEQNGCRTCKNFTVFSNDGYPTFSVTSAANFTLGCGTKAVADINIVNPVTFPTPGGVVTFTLVGPPTGAAPLTGNLSSVNAYSVNAPGTWTAITRDAASGCDTRYYISVLQNTLQPHLGISSIERNTLTCRHPAMKIEGFSNTANVSLTWAFPSGNLAGPAITVHANQLAPTSTVLAVYTLTARDHNNTCESKTIIPVYQNLFPPRAVINGLEALTCRTTTIELVNGSSSTIPRRSILPALLPECSGWVPVRSCRFS